MHPSPTTSAAVSDQQLIDAYAASGSQESFRAIVDRHARWIFAAAFRQLHDRQLAEDATQTVFVLLIQRFTSMKTHQRLSGWLFNTLQFTVRNIMRVQRRRQARELRAAMERPQTDATRLLHALEIHDQLDSAVSRLNGSDRSLILLRFYQELSFEQIATTLGISEAAARKRLTRAVDLLRRRMGAEVTPASLAVAASFGAHQIPSMLNQSVYQIAMTAKAGAAIPAGILSTTKGTVQLMIAAKLKIAALVAVALAVSVPVAVVAVENTGSTPAPSPHPAASVTAAADSTAVPAAADAPDWMADFTKTYGLAPGENVKLVPTPFVEARQEFLDQEKQNLQRVESAGAQSVTGTVTLAPGGLAGAPAAPVPGGARLLVMPNPREADAVLLSQKDAAFSSVLIKNAVTRNVGGNNSGFRISMVTQRALALGGLANVEGDKNLLTTQIPGDWVIRSGATPDQIRDGFEKVIADATGSSIKLTLQQVDVPAYVFHGTWNYKPVDALETTQQIHIYDTDMEDKNGSDTSTDSSEVFAEAITGFAGAKVLIDAQGLPDSIQYKIDYDGMAAKRNVPAVLDHIAAQTGLTWKQEIRPATHLFVEKGQ